MGVFKGFTKVQLRKPERSMFDLSHEKKLTTRMGRLTPVFISETLPNDTFKVNTEVLLRFAPLLAPIYHRVNVFVHFFFVPTRLLYKNWEKFITNGRLGTEDSPNPSYNFISDLLSHNLGLCDKSSLWDYLGGRVIQDAAIGDWANPTVSNFPAAAYYKVWYDYYRDRNYVDDNEILPMTDADGLEYADQPKVWGIKTRAWMHDYFTSALPWTQRGDEVLMPVELSGYAPLSTTGLGGTSTGIKATENPGGIAVEYGAEIDASAPSSRLYANLNEVEDIGLQTSINDFRQAVRLQEWLERNAVAGSRYNESIMAHFARRTSDGRLQRAEYLGGGRVAVQISEVMTTAWSTDGSDADVPPATMTGRGATYANKNSFRYNCEEHGFVIGIMSVMPITGYMQGIPRMFFQRRTFLDYPWPSFAHLGEQEVYKYELYATGTNVPIYSGVDLDQEPTRFGYQSRYADWKYIPNSTHGDFRGNLDFWTLDRKFASEPALGEEFVTFEDALQDRVFAVSGVDTLWCYVHNQASVVRSLPYFGTPRL